MNYEEKYKQALERAKDMLSYREVRQEDMEYLFPELAESEDERIRKDIISYLRNEKIVKRYISDIEIDKWIAWLEKQKPNTNKREIDDAYLQGICEAKHAIEKQGEQSTNKIESKFKVGNWITNGYVGGQITSIEENYPCYKIEDFMGGINSSIPFTVQDEFHLWTINDAKDGDVLVNSKDNPFIFTGKFTTNYHNPTAYCGIGNENKFIVCALNWRFHWAEKKEVAPATEEQRELLFEKMKQAGYQWDSEKKELKKIEPKTLNPGEVAEWMRVKAPKWLYDMVYPISLDVDAEDLIKQFIKDFGI